MSKYSSFTDPYSSNLAFFFKQVAPLEPIQAKLLQEYSKYPELRQYIQIEKTKDGSLKRLIIVEEDKLTAARLGLNLPPIKNG
jgi:hypothetical protein